MNKIEFILNYQFNPLLLNRVKERLQCSDTHINIIVEALKDYLIARFISLNTDSPVTMPSSSVDELWHEFIIFTRDYYYFCNEVYGQYLHHDPYGKFDIRTSEDEGIKNIIDILNNIKKHRNYNIKDIDRLNEEENDFYLLFAIDYIINGTSYENSIKESIKNIKGNINV